MTADSSTATITHSGEDDGGGVNSPSGTSLPSPWVQVVRGGNEPDSLSSPPAPAVAERSPVFSDPVMVVETETAAVGAGTQPDGSDVSINCNAGGVKKSAWNKPSANGVVEGTTTPVMGAASWPALSESTRPGAKSLSASSESSAKPTSDSLVTVSQAPVISQPPQKQVKANASSHSNPNRQRSIRRGGSAGGSTASNNRLLPPPPPPLPPPFPVFDISYGNLVPAVLDAPMREQPSFKGNNWTPRSVGGVGPPSHVVHDHPSNRNHARRSNFVPRPRGDGGHYLNNGHGGRRDHRDRDWRGPRSPANRDVLLPHQMVPPPPPPVRGYIGQPHPGPGPFFPAQSIRPYGTPMGYEMAASYLYVPTLPPEPYRGAQLLPHAASASMFVPLMDPPLHVLILNQIEYYFSDANLVKDNFLRSHMDEEGWVPITLIAGFRRVQSLTNDIQMILNSLRDSSTVEIQGDKVRRRNEWSRWIQSSNRLQADSSSQPPCETTDNLVEEASMQKLTLQDTLTMDNSFDNAYEVGASNSSKQANGEVSTEDTCS